MYNTSIKHDRSIINCLIVSNKISLEKFVIDTGAKFTCCSYKVVDEQLKETELSVCEERLIGGLVEGGSLKFYKLPLQQFTTGNINMGKQNIWITFDDKITDIILAVEKTDRSV